MEIALKLDVRFFKCFILEGAYFCVCNKNVFLGSETEEQTCVSVFADL
ncbi:hypothetical protein M472_15545 [Sphingobacterium paucimobilis HER1398]|uniref:Uncharacterized protein n=1 Tax=Sphingobacterium paucimobilis HER1398 TaxID=1346330 RepID=U2J5G8_9SPHI|nr:hypothetical protein M472_15545 [Sphingobacterium paucimobilis HER1398]